eukprot:1037784_1
MAGQFAIHPDAGIVSVNRFHLYCNAFGGNGTSTSWFYACDASTSTVIKYIFSENLECTGFPDYTKYYRDPNYFNCIRSPSDECLLKTLWFLNAGNPDNDECFPHTPPILQAVLYGVNGACEYINDQYAIISCSDCLVQNVSGGGTGFTLEYYDDSSCEGEPTGITFPLTDEHCAFGFPYEVDACTGEADPIARPDIDLLECDVCLMREYDPETCECNAACLDCLITECWDDEPRCRTNDPSTSRPTQLIQSVNASFPGDGAPISAYTFLDDPYGRFEASITILVSDPQRVLTVNAWCTECFIWQYRLSDSDLDCAWIDMEHQSNHDISVYNKRVTSMQGITTYQSDLTIQSIRRVRAGRCVDERVTTPIFKPGNMYEIRLQFADDTGSVSLQSNALSIETNRLPSGGDCIIENIENLDPLQQYNLFCFGWENDDVLLFQHNGAVNLEYNALLKDAVMNKGFVDDARNVQSVAPVGNVPITVLIKEKNAYNGITCHTIYAQFKTIVQTIDDRLSQDPSQNASNIVDDILDNVTSITDTISFSNHPDVAVSIMTVIEDIYEENLMTQSEAAQMVEDIVANLVEGSNVLDSSINIPSVVLDGDELITELSTIATITANEEIVDVGTTTLLIDDYFPQYFEAIDLFVDLSIVPTDAPTTDTDYFDTTDYEPTTQHPQQYTIHAQLYSIAIQVVDTVNNLESTLPTPLEAALEQVADQVNNLAQHLVDFATLSASKALSKANVGETFNYETIHNNKIIFATKFDANMIDFNDTTIEHKDITLPKCGDEQQNFEIPLSFMKQQDGLFDCAFMASSNNHFVSKHTRTQASDTISVNIYNVSSEPNEYQSTSCFPYLITMQLTDFDYVSDGNMSLGETYPFPSCDFWNITDSLWDTTGCFVYNLTNETVTCGCTHLTTFSVSEDKIVLEPTVRILTEPDWEEFSLYNLYRYPTVWLTCLLFLIVFAILCRINPRSAKIKTRSIISFEDIIYKSVQEEKLYKDIAGKEIRYITDYMPNQHLLGHGLRIVAPTKAAKKSLCQLQLRLFRTYLRNDHTLLSVFQRTSGTNFAVKQRLGCFFMYLCNIMVITGVFYGLEQSNPIQDVFASLIISLFSTLPVFMVRWIFTNSKPFEVKSTKH